MHAMGGTQRGGGGGGQKVRTPLKNHKIIRFPSNIDPDPLKSQSYQASGEFNDASALGRSLYCCQALHITNKDRYQSTSARRALALLNSPQHSMVDHYRHASKTPFQWRFADGSMVAHF